MGEMDFDPNTLPVPNLGLLCKNCGYLLNGLMSFRCPECGRPFTLMEYLVPLGDFPILIHRGREVVATPEIERAFNQAKIPHMPARLVCGNALAMPTQDCRLAVARENYREALLLLESLYTGALQLNDEAQAPSGWKCADCGKKNPGTFEVCWNCEKEKTENA